MKRSPLRAGFVLTELLAAAIVLAAVAAIRIALAAESRRQSTLGDDLANLKQFAFGTGAYAADFQDAVWGLSWRAGTDYGYGGIAPSDLVAQANQTVDLIRRRTGRIDIGTSINWLPHVNFAPLVLVDYLDERLPARFLASPADRLRLLWQRDPEDGYYALGPSERPTNAFIDDSVKRMPYSSSYRLAPAFWSNDAGPQAVYQTVGGGHNIYNVPPDSLLQRRLSDVAFPAQKAMVYDEFQRHFGPRVAYFGYPEARVPVLRADGSASVARTSDSNRGFYPPAPINQTSTTLVQYTPDTWQPRPLNGQNTQLVNTFYKWTRSGLRGRDFGGPEILWID